MAMGEWISVQSSRELSARELAVEKQHIAAEAEVEQAELALVYEQKGLHPSEGGGEGRGAAVVCHRVTALDTHAREELGIDPEELGGSPWVAAGASFTLFVVGAILPILPFVFLSGNTAVAVCAGSCPRSACSRSAARSRSSPAGAFSCRASGSSRSAPRRSP